MDEGKEHRTGIIFEDLVSRQQTKTRLEDRADGILLQVPCKPVVASTEGKQDFIIRYSLSLRALHASE